MLITFQSDYVGMTLLWQYWHVCRVKAYSRLVLLLSVILGDTLNICTLHMVTNYMQMEKTSVEKREIHQVWFTHLNLITGNTPLFTSSKICLKALGTEQ